MTETHNTNNKDNKKTAKKDSTRTTTIITGTAVAVLLTGLVLSYLYLSGGHVIVWSHEGLGLIGFSVVLVIYVLDGAAMISVLVAFFRAWTGRSPGIWGVLIWVMSGLSAAAQYRQGIRDKADSPDAWWFFPIMALGAALFLELTLRELRKWKESKAERTAVQYAKFGLSEWIPGIGSFKETYGSWRVSRLLGISKHDEAVSRYRQLCPTGSVRVLRAIREQYKNQDSTPDVQPVLEPEKVQDNAVQPEVQPEVQPVLASKEQGQDNTELVQDEDQDTRDLYQNPIQEPSSMTRTRTTNEQYLEMIRAEWPNEIPTGNQIRTTFKVNYEKAKKLLAELEKETSDERQTQ